MESVMNFLNANANWLVIMVTTGVSILVTYVVTRYYSPRCKVVTVKESQQVIEVSSTLHPDVKLYFQKKEISHITRSHVYLWNSGNKTIHGSEIENKDPLRVVLPNDCQVLDVFVRPTREVNGFCVDKDENQPSQVNCGFDFLDPGDGVAIKVLHTGTGRVEVVGTVRGMPGGIGDMSRSNHLQQGNIDTGELGLYFLIVAVSVLGLTASPIDWKFIALGLGTASIYLIYRHWRHRRRVPRKLLIKE